jgi:hypothetical protein
MNYNQTLVHDSFLQSLNELRDYGAFGVMFGGGHSIFEMISSISRFAAEQEPRSSMGHTTVPERHEIYKRLKTHAINWNLPASDASNAGISDRKATLEVCRQASLIFLETAVSPLSKYDYARIYHLQPLVDVAMSYLPRILPSKYSCITMWSAMIVGSCLMEEEQRTFMKNVLIHNHYMMRQTAQASNLLELLWRDSDQYAIGPYGLGLVMAKHGIDYGVI